MTFPGGTEAYRVDSEPVRARGVSFDEDDLATSSGELAQTLWDRDGKEELGELLSSLATTEFEQAGVEAILASDEVEVEQWRVGEAAAQAHLEANVDCHFPWSSRRDLKNPLASSAGAELVGFDVAGDLARLAIGEVKTSDQADAPPSVVYGSAGLIGQLSEARDQEGIAKSLMRWLGFRALDAPWGQEYREAATRLLANPRDISLFGVLVRTVPPDPGDLQSVAATLAADTADPTSIVLEAMYVSAEWLADVYEAAGSDD